MIAQRTDTLEIPLAIPRVSLSFHSLERPRMINKQRAIRLLDYPEIFEGTTLLETLDDPPETLRHTYYFYYDIVSIPQDVQTIDLTIYIQQDTTMQTLQQISLKLRRQQRKSYELLLD